MPPPRVEPHPSPPADFCVMVVGEQIHLPNQARPVQIVESTTKERPLATPRPTTDKWPHTTRWPNYISQNNEDKDIVTPSQKHQTRSHTRSILQEAMLLCVDAYQPTYQVSEDLGLLNFAEIPQSKPTFKLTPQPMLMQQLPMQWLCEMAHSVIGGNRKLLEWRHLTANPKMRATWTHSYGNEIGCLAQGMPGHNTSTTTIFFIKRTKTKFQKIGQRT
jgi:hypothetical protein